MAFVAQPPQVKTEKDQVETSLCQDPSLPGNRKSDASSTPDPQLATIPSSARSDSKNPCSDSKNNAEDTSSDSSSESEEEERNRFVPRDLIRRIQRAEAETDFVLGKVTLDQLLTMRQHYRDEAKKITSEISKRRRQAKSIDVSYEGEIKQHNDKIKRMLLQKSTLEDFWGRYKTIKKQIKDFRSACDKIVKFTTKAGVYSKNSSILDHSSDKNDEFIKTFLSLVKTVKAFEVDAKKAKLEPECRDFSEEYSMARSIRNALINCFNVILVNEEYLKPFDDYDEKCKSGKPFNATLLVVNLAHRVRKSKKDFRSVRCWIPTDQLKLKEVQNDKDYEKYVRRQQTQKKYKAKNKAAKAKRKVEENPAKDEDTSDDEGEE